MTADNSVLFDELGPRAKRRVRYASIVTILATAVLLYIAIDRLNDKGQFAQAFWEPFTLWAVQKGLLLGLWQTMKAATVAMLACILLGAILALGRLARNRPVRWLAGIYVEFFRAIPSLVLITFAFLGLPQFGVNLSSFWAVILGLTLYNSAMLAEIFRAGILSLDRGQKEAATALGLSYGQSMRYVIVPQAGRRMVPGIISQLVALLKDTSLGAALTFVELMKTAQIYANYYGNLLQMLFVASIMYMIVNFVLSSLARRLEVRQRRRYKAAPVMVAGNAEGSDLAI
jgi:glutamate transport system permease protein